MKGKRRRLWEGCKTLLILLLSCSAVFLASQTLLPSGSRAFLSQLSQPTAPPTAAIGASARSSQTLQPAAFAVTWEDGRYAVLYHQEDPEGYTQLSALIAEALSDATQPTSTTPQQWEWALAQPGVFCEYLGSMPLDTLNRWLSDQDNPALAGCAAQRLCITARTLYFADVENGERFFSASLNTDLTRALAQLTQHLSANGARFACEDGSYPLLRRDALVLSTTPTVPVLQGENTLAIGEDGTPGETLNRILQLLSFHPQTNPLYAITGGHAITDSGETLRISGSTVTYRRTDDSSVRFPAQSPLDVTRALAEETVGAFAGDARLYLDHISQTDGVTTITYSLAYRGAAIRQSGGGWCAKFTVEDDAVTAFELRLRRYTVLEGREVTLLPQEQAAAAITGSRGKNLVILYEDALSAQEELVPFWAALSEGR